MVRGRFPKPLVNPLTGESRTRKEWAKLLNLSHMGFEARYSRYKRGLLTSEQMFRVSDLCNIVHHSIDIPKVKKLQFVFRPLMMPNDVCYGYEAFLPSNLNVPIVSSIVQHSNGWAWNCYHGFDSATRTEVAKKVIDFYTRLNDDPHYNLD